MYTWSNKPIKEQSWSKYENIAFNYLKKQARNKYGAKKGDGYLYRIELAYGGPEIVDRKKISDNPFELKIGDRVEVKKGSYITTEYDRLIHVIKAFPGTITAIHSSEVIVQGYSGGTYTVMKTSLMLLHENPFPSISNPESEVVKITVKNMGRMTFVIAFDKYGHHVDEQFFNSTKKGIDKAFKYAEKLRIRYGAPVDVINPFPVKTQSKVHMLSPSGKSIFCTGRYVGRWIIVARYPNKVTCLACMRRLYKKGIYND